MKTVRVIKNRKKQKPAESEPAMDECEVVSERAMASTISDWVNELRNERRSPHASPDRFVSRLSRMA
ncbi:MAG: hypothetical protein IPM63_06065 [Acidobacteriota bacterium]|nr:MAG: hypothetical protein IPM63_06065 [Acidobacteriota bacterium]